MGEEAKAKGTILSARLAFLRNRGGEPLVERVLARLEDADRKTLRGILLVTSSYPLALSLRLDAAIAAELTPDDPDRVFLELGRSSADVNLAGPQRLFMRAGDPQYLLSFTDAIYRYYYSAGHRTYEKTGPKTAVLVTHDAEGATPGDCLTIVGWHQRAIELSGGKNPVVSHPVCRARGGDRCEYRCSWE
jgi:uncharacterized protein (TIGR02265 family)